jgi:probable DNA repair protein
MGTMAGAEIDAWLREGGTVVTASERGARALVAAYHRARRAEGLTAWTAPDIQDWKAFVRTAWGGMGVDDRLVLNTTQEQSLWARIASDQSQLATSLEGPRYRLATMAMEAHGLICSHAPGFLRSSARSGWQNDAGAFSRWLVEFDAVCRAGKLVSPARLPVELLAMLKNEAGAKRKPLLLAGFDRMQPIQKAVLEAWGEWRAVEAGERASAIEFHEAPDELSELAACARWCRRTLEERPGVRILVITQDAAKNRGLIERAFLGLGPRDEALAFEFSLGVSLGSVELPRAAHILLRWLSGALAEHELDWLFSCGYAAAGRQESAMLQAHMRALRRRGFERPEWTLTAFMESIGRRRSGVEAEGDALRKWSQRILGALRQLDELRSRQQSPLEWAELAPRLLEAMSFARAGALSSMEFQAFRRFEQAIETTGSLGFDGRRVGWAEFLSALGRALEGTLFAPESRDAAIQIAGPAESAGLSADAIWFLGTTEDTWPSKGAMHPMLPPEVQRETAMPHATPQLDWDLAESITVRLLNSAPQIHFSYSRQVKGVESRPSRLIAQFALPQAVEFESARAAPLTISIEDWSRVAREPGALSGGAAILSSQSQCPFKAFAASRLGAQSWEPAQIGLSPSQRGLILHAVLRSVWGGPPDGIRSHAELTQIADRDAWIEVHVDGVFGSPLVAALRERMPERYLKLEQRRLVALIAQWLEYESQRIPFEVLETEADRNIALRGLSINLRLDRLDKLNDGSVLVIDYKTGDVQPKAWDLPRPEDVQLPVYAGFGLKPDEELGGLVFAKLRIGKNCFAGSVGAAAETLLAGLKGNSSLMKRALTAEQLLDWKESIEQLAEDFLNGRAAVDPRDYPKTCERCGLQTLCRIQEHRLALADDDEGEESGDDSGAGDE